MVLATPSSISSACSAASAPRSQQFRSALRRPCRANTMGVASRDRSFLATRSTARETLTRGKPNPEA
jgi:hypothetical protein